MNLLMLSRLFPNATAPTFGQFNLQLARALAGHCDLDVVAPLPNRSAPPEQRDGIRVRYPRYFAVPLLNRAMAGRSIAHSLRRLRLKPDAILATFAWPDGYAAVQCDVPVVIKIGGSDIDMLPSWGPRRVQTLLALHRCRRIYVVAQSLRDKVVALGLPTEKLMVIHNGVDPTLFKPRDRIAARRELGLPEKDKIITYVGWIESQKGVEYLLRAHAKMSPRPLLALVGRGSPCQHLTKQIGTADRCRFVGEQPHTTIATWMNAADALAFPSLHEGCPNVVLEALACGLPMVATNVGGIPEVTPRAPWCELVPPRDGKALTAAMQRLLAGNWDRREIARSCQRTWDDVAREVYQLIVAAARPEPVPSR